MKHFFLPIIIFLVLVHIHSDTLVGMEKQIPLARAESERLTQMVEALDDNKRIGQLATLIIEKHVKESYYNTILKEVQSHPFIITKEKVTEKSYTCKYIYNPFIVTGLCLNDNSTPLVYAFLKMLQNDFNPETERNNLNDYFYEKYDKPNELKQVDFCVSAKYIPSNNQYEYIARFFNKEKLLNTIHLFNSNNS